MRNNLVSGLILCLWAIGIGFFVIGIILASVYPDNSKVLGYSKTKCNIHNHTIGKLNICDTGTGFEDFYMAVWNSLLGNKSGITTVLLPDSRYLNRSRAKEDIENGPNDGIVDCMCPKAFDSVPDYPNLNDDNDIDCDVWKACFIDVNSIEKEQNTIRKGNKASEVMFYIGISIEGILVIFVVTVFCLHLRED